MHQINITFLLIFQNIALSLPYQNNSGPDAKINLQGSSKKNMKTSKEILSRTKGLNFNECIELINNIGLNMELIMNFGFCKMWDVFDNSEISTISVTIKNHLDNSCDIKFTFNE